MKCFNFFQVFVHLCYLSDLVDPIEVLDPFLFLLRSSNLAGPFKLAALDSIQAFINTDILCEYPSKTGEALAKIVESISRFEIQNIHQHSLIYVVQNPGLVMTTII